MPNIVHKNRGDTVPAWTPITIAAGWTAGTDGCWYRVVNGVCYLKGAVVKDTAMTTSPSTFATLPTEARPSVYARYFGYALNQATSSYAILDINTDGAMRGYLSGSGTLTAISLTGKSFIVE